jgi:2-polyprenyl-6-methoxyphenol hydroxylase-like FAD-dependent oxidoreductase
MLIEQSRQYEGFTFRPGLVVRGLLTDDAGRVCGVRCHGAAGECEIEGDLVIGTDGRSSLVRKRAGIELTLLPESYDVLWLKTETPKEMEGHTPIHIYAEGSDAAFTYVSWDGRWQIAWLLQKGEWKNAKKRDWLAECAALMPESTAAHLLAHRDDLEGPNLLDVIVGRCARWHEPGVLLLGDAAHPMSPVRAQGINMALRDAIVAANHLVPAARSGRGLESACADIKRERDREIIRVQKLQIREVRGQRWAREKPWLMTPMLKLAPAIGRLPGIEKMFLWQQKPLRFGVTKVRLEV